MDRSVRVRISFGIATGFAILRTLDYMLDGSLSHYSLWNQFRVTAELWTVVAVLLVITLKVRAQQSSRTSGLMIGASLVVAPFAIQALMGFFGSTWPWLACGAAVIAGVIDLRRISEPTERSAPFEGTPAG